MKTKILCCLLPLAASVLLGCTSGNVVVTGTQKESIDYHYVKLYAEAPGRYEVMGVVSAKSDAGWTDQKSLDYAIEELKKQAAKIGANGIILDGSADSFLGYQAVSGKAIYVDSE